VSVGDRCEDLCGQVLGEERGALSLAAAAEASTGPATEGEKVLGAAHGAPDAREASLEAPARQELLDGAYDDRPERAGARLEAFFIGPDVTVEVILE